MNAGAGIRTFGAAVSLMLAFTSGVAAHHSAAATYDADHTVRIVGKVAAFAWKNPHCHLYVSVASGPFEGQQYTVELSSAEVLATSGWTKTLLRPGDDIVLDVHPSRLGAAIGLCRNCPMIINGHARPRAAQEG